MVHNSCVKKYISRTARNPSNAEISQSKHRTDNYCKNIAHYTSSFSFALRWTSRTIKRSCAFALTAYRLRKALFLWNSKRSTTELFISGARQCRSTRRICYFRESQRRPIRKSCGKFDTFLASKIAISL